MRRLLIACGLLVATSAAALAQAPDPAALILKIGEASKANAAALRAYSWKQRVVVTMKGEAKPAKLYEMRFDQDGKVQKTSLTPAAPKPAAPEPSKGRGLKGRAKEGLKENIVENKIEDAKEYADDLAELCKSYLVPSPALLQKFFAAAKPAEQGGLLKLSATGVLAEGDSLTYELDAASHALKRILFTAKLDGDPVEATVEMASVPNGGPNYAARTIVNAPGKKLSATIENFEYVKH